MKSAVRLLAYGEALVDFFADGPDSGTFARHVGGSSANLALAASALGVRASVAARVGDDAQGAFVRRSLAGAGVDVTALLTTPGFTSMTFIERDADGEPSFVPVRSPAVDAPPLLGRGAASGADAVVVATEACFRPAWHAAWARLASDVRRAKSLLVLDINARPKLWSSRRAARVTLAGALPSFALVKASTSDLARLDPGGDAVRGERWALRHLSPGAHLVVTGGGVLPVRVVRRRGEGGLVAAIAVEPVPVVDATGAGDAFLAALVASLVPVPRPWPVALLVDAVTRACSHAALVLGGVGSTAGLRIPRPRGRLAEAGRKPETRRR